MGLCVLLTSRFSLYSISVAAPMDVADGDEDEAAALEAAMAMSMGGAAVPAPRKSHSRSILSGEVATWSSLRSAVSTGSRFYSS